jgi:hypothetical protein
MPVTPQGALPEVASAGFVCAFAWIAEASRSAAVTVNTLLRIAVLLY